MLGRKLSIMMLILLAMLMFLAVFAAIPVMAEDTGAKIWTDKADYSPGETATIYGSGFVADASVTITVTRPDNSTNTWSVTSDSSGGFTTTYPLDGIEGTYYVTATDGTNTATTTFTDVEVHHVDFATSGLPSGVSITVSWSKTNPAGKPATGTTTFNSPGPSTPDEGTKPSTTFTYSGFPSSVTVSGVTYNLVSTSPTSPFTTGADKQWTHVTATYTVATFSVTFDASAASPLTDVASGTVIVTGTIGGSPFSVTNGELPKTFTGIAYGTTVTYSFTDPVDTTIDGKKFVKLSVTGPASGFSVTGDTIVTGNYQLQYRLTMNTNFGSTSPLAGEHWYPAGTVLAISASSPLVVDGEQYVWLGWSGTEGTGGGSYTGMLNPATDSVAMNSPITETAAWRHEFRLTMSTNFGTTSPSVGEHWYEVGTPLSISATAPSLLYPPGQEQYVWNGWTGSGTISYTGTDNPAPITMNSPITETASWTHQYYLTMSTNYGTVSPGSGWHDAGSVVSISATAPALVYSPDQERYVWNGWTGSGFGTYYSGMDNPKTITMDGPITEAASWTHEYKLVMATANFGTTSPSLGEHWKEAGSSFNIQAFAPDLIYSADEEQYVWLGWTGSGPGSYTNGDNLHQITMNGPISETAAWRHEYYLTVNTNPAEVLDLNPAAVSGQGWYEAGTTATVDAVQLVDKVAGESRYDFRSWTGATPTGEGNKATVYMDSPKTATANYQLQYKITFDQSGVGSDFTGTVVTIDGTNYVLSNTNTLPASFWWDDQSIHSFAFQSPLMVNSDKRYVWTSTTGLSNAQSDSLFKVTGYGSVTGNYKTQYKLTVYVDPAAVGITNIVINPTGEDSSSNTDWKSYWYDINTDVTLTATSPVEIDAASRWRFDHWSGDASGTSTSTSVTMSAARSVTANYIIQFKLTVSTDPTVLIPQPTVSPSSSDWFYDINTVVSIDPNSPAGYTFDHWVINGLSSGSTVPLSVTMDSAKNVIAVFTFNLAVETGFKAGDSPSFASDPYLTDIMCVLIKATNGYKLVGTSPGTYDYAIAIKNTGTSTFTSITISVTGSSDFILHSQNPVRVLNEYGDISAQFTVSGTWPTITIQSNGGFTGLLGSKSLYVTIHLDYKLKGQIFSSSIYSKAYTFKTTITGTSGPNSGTKDPYGSVAFLSKKTTIICGFVKTSSGKPIENAKIELYNGNGQLYTEYTDADGFFCFIDGWDGVTLSGGITYTVKCTLPPDSTVLPTQSVTAQASKAVAVNFTKP